MPVDDAQAEVDAARAALVAFEEKQVASDAALKEERAQVNQRYQAAEAALAEAQRAAQPPNDAPAQTVEG